MNCVATCRHAKEIPKRDSLSRAAFLAFSFFPSFPSPSFRFPIPFRPSVSVSKIQRAGLRKRYKPSPRSGGASGGAHAPPHLTLRVN